MNFVIQDVFQNSATQFAFLVMLCLLFLESQLLLDYTLHLVPKELEKSKNMERQGYLIVLGYLHES